MPANEERSISLGQLQERPMKEPTSDTEGRYGDGAARTKVRRPKPKALLYHVCSNRIELLFQNGEHKVALVRSAIKQGRKGRFPTSREVDEAYYNPEGDISPSSNLFISDHSPYLNQESYLPDNPRKELKVVNLQNLNQMKPPEVEL
ncbi:hypothetical protein Tco_0860342 [Tanacetum coccineum]|uniref:Uncharacterized protein n=1 Tax=Tanacetum coccineum TaxID=301880 RepID=A0ABQ5BEP2_9ASTR